MTRDGAAAQSAADTARSLFSRYNKQDIPAMIELFVPGGTVEYVPLALSGPVEKVGPESWGTLIESFPDLTNEVLSVRETGDRRTAYVDVNISGTQAKDVFGVKNKRRFYKVRHLFIVETNENGKIAHLTSFWDNADWYRQLGKTRLD